ncbi:ProQ/FINO family protein [Marinomonas pollencensis]|uniref:ProP effector n=1 Tax=Marinomonas pollencensis TaxID=491954 RepID=A0A3E0DI32_9GAMM|nr:ProQ/FINO family protein [Marinomonas pollencensis]REG81434.1 ProP effector [Marinomonas pollencensis]
MEQLIAKLEAEVDQLIEQLKVAHEEIAQLKTQQSDSSDNSSASMDLLQNMVSRSTEDQLQLYIEDSLDLLVPAETKNTSAPTSTVDTQLSFDLLNSLAETSITTTTTEQTDYMTIQQTELNGLPEVQDETQVETTTDVQPASESTQEAATLTPEQKKRQKNQKNNRRLIKMLEDRYPKAFDWNQPKPLKVGIDKDMVLDDEFNASKQKRALAAYTRSDRYKKCLLSGQPRIDLEGTPVNNEPALPESMIPKKEKTTFNRPKGDRMPRSKAKTASNKKAPSKPSHKPKNTQNTQKNQDDAYDNLSPEERMKAKLEKLLNK